MYIRWAQLNACPDGQEEFQPDGGYIPRILFADAQNKLKPSLSNPGRADQYKYYYTSVGDVSPCFWS
jgi:hypothetical protein